MEYFRPTYSPNPDEVVLEYVRVPLWALLLDRAIGWLSAQLEDSDGWASRSSLGTLVYHGYGRWLYVYEDQVTVVDSYPVSRHFARVLGVLVEED